MCDGKRDIHTTIGLEYQRLFVLTLMSVKVVVVSSQYKQLLVGVLA